MRTKLVTCPCCNGTGLAPLGVQSARGDWEQECRRCRGSGEVSTRAHQAAQRDNWREQDWEVRA